MTMGDRAIAPRPDVPGLVIRPFDAERDFPAMAEVIVASAAHAGNQWRPTPDQLRHEWLTTAGFVPERDARIAEADGHAVATVAIDWRVRGGDRVTHHIDLWVRPEVRRRGLGGALLTWAEERSRASVADGTGGPPELAHRLDGFGDSAVGGHAELATSRGYAPIRYFFEMHRPLGGPIPDLPLPVGLEIRPALPEHHRAIWAADCEAFLDHWEAAKRTDEDMVGMFEQPDTDPSLWLVAWDGDEVAGSVLNWILSEENAAVGIARGWLVHVSVRRAWRGRGLASSLIAASLRLLTERGMTEAALGVDAENPTGALRLYESLGFTVARTSIMYRKLLDLSGNR